RSRRWRRAQLRVQANGSFSGARDPLVSTAESRQQVVKRFLVRKVHQRQTGATLFLIRAKNAVVPIADPKAYPPAETNISEEPATKRMACAIDCHSPRSCCNSGM